MLKNAKLVTKIIGGFCLVLLLTTAAGIAGYIGTTKTYDDLVNVAQGHMPAIHALLSIYQGQTQAVTVERGLYNRQLMTTEGFRQGQLVILDLS